MSDFQCLWCGRPGAHRHISQWQFCEGQTVEVAILCDVCWGLANLDEEAVTAVDRQLAQETEFGRESDGTCWWCSRPLVYEDGVSVVDDRALLCGICASLTDHSSLDFEHEDRVQSAADMLAQAVSPEEDEKSLF